MVIYFGAEEMIPVSRICKPAILEELPKRIAELRFSNVSRKMHRRQKRRLQPAEYSLTRQNKRVIHTRRGTVSASFFPRARSIRAILSSAMHRICARGSFQMNRYAPSSRSEVRRKPAA